MCTIFFKINFTPANPLILGILFSTEVNGVFVAKLLISGILPSISVILALESVFLTRSLVFGILFSTIFNAVFVAKLLISGILFYILVILAS